MSNSYNQWGNNSQNAVTLKSIAQNLKQVYGEFRNAPLFVGETKAMVERAHMGAAAVASKNSLDTKYFQRNRAETILAGKFLADRMQNNGAVGMLEARFCSLSPEYANAYLNAVSSTYANLTAEDVIANGGFYSPKMDTALFQIMDLAANKSLDTNVARQQPPQRQSQRQQQTWPYSFTQEQRLNLLSKNNAATTLARSVPASSNTFRYATRAETALGKVYRNADQYNDNVARGTTSIDKASVMLTTRFAEDRRKTGGQPGELENWFNSVTPDVADLYIEQLAQKFPAANENANQYLVGIGLTNLKQGYMEKYAEGMGAQLSQLSMDVKMPAQNVPRQSVPRQNIPQPNVPRQNVPRQNIPKQNVPQQSVPAPQGGHPRPNSPTFFADKSAEFRRYMEAETPNSNTRALYENAMRMHAKASQNVNKDEPFSNIGSRTEVDSIVLADKFIHDRDRNNGRPGELEQWYNTLNKDQVEYYHERIGDHGNFARIPGNAVRQQGGFYAPSWEADFIRLDNKMKEKFGISLQEKKNGPQQPAPANPVPKNPAQTKNVPKRTAPVNNAPQKAVTAPSRNVPKKPTQDKRPVLPGKPAPKDRQKATVTFRPKDPKQLNRFTEKAKTNTPPKVALTQSVKEAKQPIRVAPKRSLRLPTLGANVKLPGGVNARRTGGANVRLPGTSSVKPAPKFLENMESTKTATAAEYLNELKYVKQQLDEHHKEFVEHGGHLNDDLSAIRKTVDDVIKQNPSSVKQISSALDKALKHADDFVERTRKEGSFARQHEAGMKDINQLYTLNELVKNDPPISPRSPEGNMLLLSTKYYNLTLEQRKTTAKTWLDVKGSAVNAKNMAGCSQMKNVQKTYPNDLEKLRKSDSKSLLSHYQYANKNDLLKKSIGNSPKPAAKNVTKTTNKTRNNGGGLIPG